MHFIITLSYTSMREAKHVSESITYGDRIRGVELKGLVWCLAGACNGGAENRVAVW